MSRIGAPIPGVPGPGRFATLPSGERYRMSPRGFWEYERQLPANPQTGTAASTLWTTLSPESAKQFSLPVAPGLSRALGAHQNRVGAAQEWHRQTGVFNPQTERDAASAQLGAMNDVFEDQYGLARGSLAGRQALAQEAAALGINLPGGGVPVGLQAISQMEEANPHFVSPYASGAASTRAHNQAIAGGPRQLAEALNPQQPAQSAQATGGAPAANAIWSVPPERIPKGWNTVLTSEGRTTVPDRAMSILEALPELVIRRNAEGQRVYQPGVVTQAMQQVPGRSRMIGANLSKEQRASVEQHRQAGADETELRRMTGMQQRGVLESRLTAAAAQKMLRGEELTPAETLLLNPGGAAQQNAGDNIEQQRVDLLGRQVAVDEGRLAAEREADKTPQSIIAFANEQRQLAETDEERAHWTNIIQQQRAKMMEQAGTAPQAGTQGLSRKPVPPSLAPTSDFGQFWESMSTNIASPFAHISKWLMPAPPKIARPGETVYQRAAAGDPLAQEAIEAYNQAVRKSTAHTSGMYR